MATTKIITEVTDLNSASSTNGLKMPTGTAYSGTPTDGMVRNSSETGSQGSANVMQHFNGTEWKNYENLASTYSVDYLVVAGGGGGGAEIGGGGGAGGYLASTGYTLTPSTTYTITVGGGGAAGINLSNYRGGNGTNSIFDSIFDTITATGGGGGGSRAVGYRDGNSGGSGGGGGGDNLGSPGSGTSGQGNDGGRGKAATSPAGGGGGAGAVGGTTTSETSPGSGGNGLQNDILVSGTNVYYAGGGGGGYNANNNGGLGGGGTGGRASGAGSLNPGDGTDFLGGGGGGGSNVTYDPDGGQGGSGVVILRIPTASFSGTTEGSPDVSYNGSDTILKYTGSGSYTA